MEIRGVGAGPTAGMRRGEEFSILAAPVLSTEGKVPRPKPPRRLSGALLLSSGAARRAPAAKSWSVGAQPRCAQGWRLR